MTMRFVILLSFIVYSLSQKELKFHKLYNEIRSNADNVVRIQNIDVTLREDQPIEFCHLVMMGPISQLKEEIASFALAVEHFNSGAGIIVKELDGLNETCNIRFTTEILDTKRDPALAVKEVTKMVGRTPGVDRLPCAFIGAHYSPVSIATSFTTNVYGYPQLSYGSTSEVLDNNDQFPLFGRLIPSDSDALYILQLFVEQFETEYIGILYVNDAYGASYVDAINRASLNFKNVTIRAFPFSNQGTTEEIKWNIENLKKTKFRYIFAIIYPEFYEKLMTEAHRQEIAGKGNYTWIFAQSLSGSRITSMQGYPRNSIMHNVSKGIGIVGPRGGIVPHIHPPYSKFIEAWKDLKNIDDISYLNSMLMSSLEQNYSIDSDLFKFQNSIYNPFLYDSVAALGLAACELSGSGVNFTGKEHFDTTLRSSFIGASGKIDLDLRTGSRAASSVLFVLTNMIEKKISGGNVTFLNNPASYYKEKQWKNTLTPFKFKYDGSENHAGIPPVEIIWEETFPVSYLMGTVLAALSTLISSVLFIWTYCNRMSRVVKASQPFFLYLICFGTFLSGLSIYVTSMEFINTSDDFACMAYSWLFHLGFGMTFSALFTKTHRVNLIFHSPKKFKRFKVTVKDVMKPMIILITVYTIILTANTMISPFRWETGPINISNDEFGRPNKYASYCECEMWYTFVVPVMLIDAGCLAVATYEAYVARAISMEFAESDYIFRALSVICGLYAAGIPVVMLASNHDKIVVMVMVILTFFLNLSLFLCIFVPKIIYRYQDTCTDNALQRQVTAFVSSNPTAYPHHCNQDPRESTRSGDDGLQVFSRPLMQQTLKEENYKLKKVSKFVHANPSSTYRHRSNPDTSDGDSLQVILHLKEENYRLKKNLEKATKPDLLSTFVEINDDNGLNSDESIFGFQSDCECTTNELRAKGREFDQSAEF